MLLFNIFQNSGRSKIYYYGKIVASQQNQIKKFSKSCYNIQEKILCTKTTTMRTNYHLKRFYSDETDESSSLRILLPPLTDDKPRTMPNFIKAFSSAYYLQGVIGAQLDPEFNMTDFVEGSKQAVVVVSEALAREDYDSLIGLVANNVIDKLRDKISTLTLAQRNLIAVNKYDIFGSFPYETKVVYEGDQGSQRTFAEITMVHQILKNRKEFEANELTSIFNMKPILHGEDRVFVCNYKYRRDYTNGNTEPWIIYMCNHFMPMAGNLK